MMSFIGFCTPVTRALMASNTQRAMQDSVISRRVLVFPSSQSTLFGICALKGFLYKQSLVSCSGTAKPVSPLRACTTSPPSDLEQHLREVVSTNPVVIFSKTWCGFCAQVKSLFHELGVPSRIIELDELGNEGMKIQDILYGWTKQRTVPNVFVGGKHIGGCSDTLEAYERGELQNWIEEAKRKSTSS